MLLWPLRMVLRVLLLALALVWVPWAIASRVDVEFWWVFASLEAFLWYAVGFTLLVALVTAGGYTGSVTVDDGAGGSTSVEFTALILDPGQQLPITAIDADGDGFPDALETVLGSAPGDFASTPNGSPATGWKGCPPRPLVPASTTSFGIECRLLSTPPRGVPSLAAGVA